MPLREWIVGLCLLIQCGCARHTPGPMRPAPPFTAESPTPVTTAPVATAPSIQAKVIAPFPDITVHLDPAAGSRVEIKAFVCLNEGFLEQVACSPATREHESLVVVRAKPSRIHAALLLAGFNPGAPGRWSYANNTISTIDPTGDKIAVFVRYADASGRTIEAPIRTWIRNAAPLPGQAAGAPASHQPFPDVPWVFGGSAIASNPKPMPPGEHYVADVTGSIIGLVTFGDEVLGLSRVLSDKDEVQAPEWEANTEAIPPVETEVTLILRRWNSS